MSRDVLAISRLFSSRVYKAARFFIHLKQGTSNFFYGGPHCRYIKYPWAKDNSKLVESNVGDRVILLEK